MPSENVANRLPSDALDAFLDGILAELRDPTDPIALDEIRVAFRKRVPFRLRSYAAAALILRAAGLSRSTGRSISKEPLTSPIREPRKDIKAKQPGPDELAKAEGKTTKRALHAKEAERSALPPRPRYAGSGVTLFFSMGKRQRLYPRILIDLVIDVAGLSPESIGDVRAFDNYSFADIDPQRSDAVISALNGYEFRGRKLSVGPAKKRDGQAVAD